MNPENPVQTVAGAMWSAADDAQSLAVDVAALLRMARDECQWSINDPDSGYDAQTKLHLLLEAAQGKVAALTGCADSVLEGLRTISTLS